jgi:hypothetical protein
VLQHLKQLGAAVFLSADPGRSPLINLGLLSVMYGIYAGYLHGVATVALEGVSAVEFTDLGATWFGGLSAALPRFAQQIASSDYRRSIGSTLTMQNEGLQKFADWSAERGGHADLIAPIRQLIARRVTDGFGEDGIASLFELLRPQKTAEP